MINFNLKWFNQFAMNLVKVNLQHEFNLEKVSPEIQINSIKKDLNPFRFKPLFHEKFYLILD